MLHFYFQAWRQIEAFLVSEGGPASLVSYIMFGIFWHFFKHYFHWAKYELRPKLYRNNYEFWASARHSLGPRDYLNEPQFRNLNLKATVKIRDLIYLVTVAFKIQCKLFCLIKSCLFYLNQFFISFGTIINIIWSEQTDARLAASCTVEYKQLNICTENAQGLLSLVKTL